MASKILKNTAFQASNQPPTQSNRAQAAIKLIALFTLTPLALCAAQAAHSQTLPTVTIKSSADDGYSPASSSTATKGSAALRDIPQSVNVVPKQLLQDQAARSMEDALKNVPGVALSHGDGQRDQVTIRGFSAIADQFVDGVRDDALYFRDLSNIERIEVLKGPSAVLYGRGSSGGLINRVTKKPIFGETTGDATLNLGSYGLKRVSSDINLPLGESVALRLNLAKEDSDSYRTQQFIDRYSFAPSLAFRLSPDTNLLLQYTKAKDKRVTDFGIPALNGKPVDVAVGTYYGSSKARADDTSTSNVNSYAAVLDHRFSQNFSIKNTTRVYDYKLDRFNTLSNGITDPTALTIKLSRSAIFRDESGWFNQTDLTYKTTLGGMKHEILFGAEVGQQKRRSQSISAGTILTVPIFNPGTVVVPAFTAAQLNAAIPSHTLQDILGLYVQDQVTLAKDWKALAGVRFDQFKQRTRFDRVNAPLERTDNSFSPRAGLVWQPSESQSYYASYSRSFQPSAETFALAASNTANVPEITRNLEIGTKLDFLNGALSVNAALFNLRRTNIKNTDPANPTLSINAGTQRTNGLELTATGRLPYRWDISAGYSYMDGKMVQSVANVNTQQIPVIAVSALGKVPSLTPRHSAFLWGMKTLDDGFKVGGGMNYVGERFTSLTNAVTLPAHLTADLAASYSAKSYEIGVNLKNAFNKKYYVSSHGSADNLILPGAPRELQVALKVKF